jgi:uncharacterized membrane protein (UPF0182 family)
MRPPIPPILLSRRTKIVLAVVVSLIVLIVIAVKLTGVYINWLWFGSVGHRNVYVTVFWTRFWLFLIFGLLMALIICGNLVAAYLMRPPFRPMSAEQQNLQRWVVQIEPRRKLVLAAIALIAFFSAGASAQGDWTTWQLWLHGDSFHQTDPEFHKDISFFAFDYPAYRLMLGFGFTAIIFSLILTIGVHYLSGAIRFQTPGPKVTIAARRHITVLVFVFMALKAAAYWLDRYAFVFSDRSKFTGANYTDVHAALPAKTILFWITIVLALGVLASLWLRSAILPGIGFVVMMVLSVLMVGIYPAIIQQVQVKPNASDKEAPYISRNIAATRDAYGIQSVTATKYAATATPSAAALTDTNTTVDNIRILDPNVISPTFVNAQKIGLPYTFSSNLDVDRYTIDGVTHDYVVAVREQAPGSNLSSSQNNWINQHTVYTHGYGFVAAEADIDVTNATSKAAYTEGDIPPKGKLNVTQPDVYYGQLGNDYAIVGAKGKAREFDGNASQNVTYHGKGGVSLSNLFTRLAFAVNYGETSFVLNDAVSANGARIIFNRDPRKIVQKVAPFLTVDSDPFPFVNESTGHIMWMLDGYTTMANFPYSERQSLSTLTGTSLRQGQRDTQINYIRNSVKATVDAYDGTVTLYQWDTKDPVLKAWMQVFPGLVKPKQDLVDNTAVYDHIRYPQDLFNVQRSLLAQYHITDPVAWYNGKGKWQVPLDPFAAGNQPPYYVLAGQPGGANTPEFQLTTPMVVPGGSNNLAAYVSVGSDPGKDYGTFTVLQVPSNANIYGPSQIANVFKSKSVISKDISLLNAGQSQVLHGNLLTLPVGDSFLYVEPLYVQATGAGSYPTLQRVLVQYGSCDGPGCVGYGATLDDALADIRQGREPGTSLTALGQTSGNAPGSNSTAPNSSSSAPSSSSTPPTTTTTTPTTTPPTTNVPGEQVQLLNNIEKYFNDSQAALKRGDVAAYGADLQKAQNLIKQYLAKYGKLPNK